MQAYVIIKVADHRGLGEDWQMVELEIIGSCSTVVHWNQFCKAFMFLNHQRDWALGRCIAVVENDKSLFAMGEQDMGNSLVLLVFTRYVRGSEIF